VETYYAKYCRDAQSKDWRDWPCFPGDAVTRAIETEIGQIARPKNVWIVPDMPKTRSGKIMRRVLASISNTSDVGDITTLANPKVVEHIRRIVQG